MREKCRLNIKDALLSLLTKNKYLVENKWQNRTYFRGVDLCFLFLTALLKKN